MTDQLLAKTFEADIQRSQELILELLLNALLISVVGLALMAGILVWCCCYQALQDGRRRGLIRSSHACQSARHTPRSETHQDVSNPAALSGRRSQRAPTDSEAASQFIVQRYG